jgi:PAS domain S-box-containing protein
VTSESLSVGLFLGDVPLLEVVILFGALVTTALFIAAAALAVPHRSTPGTVPFLVVCLSLAMQPGPIAIRWIQETQVTTVLFGSFVVAALAWVILASEYTGRGPTMTSPRVALLGAYGAVTILGVAVPLEMDGAVRGLVFALNQVLQITLFALIVYATFLVGRTVIRYGDLSRASTTLLGTLGGGLSLLMLSRVLTPQVPVELLRGPQLVLLVAMGIVFVVTQQRYDVFETGPSAGYLARETVFDELSQAAFIIDRDDQILDCNQTAATLFGANRTQLMGRQVDDVLGEINPVEGAVRLDGDTGHKTHDTEVVALETVDGNRQFELLQTRLATGAGESVGRALLLEDVTERTTHEQRVEVLNRVLRHNLRNDLDAINGFAEALEYDSGEEGTETVAHLEQIEETALDLVDLGETVGRTERILGREQRQQATVDVVAVTDSLCEQYRHTHPDATISLDAPDAMATVRTDGRVFEAVLDQVLENALEHNDRPNPHVTVCIETTDGELRIDVIDDGPGIPRGEQEVLLQGEETALRHGTGVGLWFVHWGLTQLGGELELRENEPRGSVVTLVFPSLSE